MDVGETAPGPQPLCGALRERQWSDLLWATVKTTGTPTQRSPLPSELLTREPRSHAPAPPPLLRNTRPGAPGTLLMHQALEDGTGHITKAALAGLPPLGGYKENHRPDMVSLQLGQVTKLGLHT